MDELSKHLSLQYKHAEFRPFQREIITCLLEAEDVIAVLPTGAGKSLLYLFIATYTQTTVLVISPLIALMKDQSEKLALLGVRSCTINSTRQYSQGDLDEAQVLFITPESVPSKLDLIRRLLPSISLFAVDEAHCITQWSKDFRPSYRGLSKLRGTFPDVPILAVTATATPSSRNEIAQVLGLSEYSSFVGSTNRPNMAIAVHSSSSFEVREVSNGTIIYINSKKGAEFIAEKLQELGNVRADVYHAGLSQEKRTCVHEAFIAGTLDVVVATVAFGMGIDKSNIRHVINYGIPSSLESYYQEIGRAGRDGKPCKASLYWNHGDFVKAGIIGSSTRAIEMLRTYVEDKTRCRQEMLEAYFKTGKISLTPISHDRCGKCDNCLRKPSDGGERDVTSLAQIIVDAITSHKIREGFCVGASKIRKEARSINKSLTSSVSKEDFGVVISEMCRLKIIKRGGRSKLVLEPSERFIDIPKVTIRASEKHQPQQTPATKLERISACEIQDAEDSCDPVSHARALPCEFNLAGHHVLITRVVKKGGRAEGKVRVAIKGPTAAARNPVSGLKVIYAGSVEDAVQKTERFVGSKQVRAGDSSIVGHAENEASIKAVPPKPDCPKQASKSMTYVYTDGSCLGNGGPGAIASGACYFGPGHQSNKAARVPKAYKQTNNTGELLGMIMAGEAIATLPLGKFTIVSDSTYAIGYASKSCAKLNEGGGLDESIPNLELVQKLLSTFSSLSNVEFMHVKAHTGGRDQHSIGNAHADRLARAVLDEEPAVEPAQIEIKIGNQVVYSGNSKEQAMAALSRCSSA